MTDGAVTYYELRETSEVDFLRTCFRNSIEGECKDADFNGDGIIDADDLIRIIDTMNTYDLNGDGKIDFREQENTELSILQSCFGKNPEGTCAKSDINGDGIVDIGDVLTVAGFLNIFDNNEDKIIIIPVENVQFKKYTTPIEIIGSAILNFYSIDRAGNKEDVRTEVYTIGKPDRYMTVTSPNGGETLTAGQNYRIIWDSSDNIDKVWLGYSFGVGSLDWIATDLDNTGSYDWKVDIGNTTNTQLKIRVIGFETGVGSADDESDNFFTVNPPNCTLDSAFWQPVEATQGQTVKLNVTGSNCDGKNISFQVNEDDIWFDNAAQVQPKASIFVDGKATADWVAERGDIFGDSKYYFIATLDDPGMPTIVPVNISSENQQDGILSVTPRGGSDTEAPKVTAFKISPSEVDTSNQEQEIKVTMTLTDNNAGVCIYDYGTYVNCSGSGTNIYLSNDTSNQSLWIGNFKRISGDEFNGTYEGTAILPQGSAEGEWKASLYLSDRLGNSQHLYVDELETMFGVGSATVNNTDGPVTTASLPSGTYGNDIEITLEVDRPAQTYYTLDGTEPTENSTKYAVPIKISDNYTELRFFSVDEQGRKEETKTRVYNIDKTAPQIAEFTLTPGEINTEINEQAVTLTMSLWDDSGVCISIVGQNTNCTNSSPTQVRLSHNGSTQYTTFFYFSRISGDEFNGIYTSTVALPVGSAGGDWKAELFVLDKFGNNAFIGTQELEGRFGEGTATVANHAGPSDVAAPEVTSFSIEPKKINTSLSDQEVVLTMTLADESGVCVSLTGQLIDCTSSSPTQAMLFSEDKTHYISFYNFTRTSGDEFNGTYTSTISMPKGSLTGSWKTTLFVLDNMGNSAFINDASIEAKFGAGSATVVNEHQPCQLTGTAWNMTTASKGDTVEFHVIGNNCDGEAVNVRIMEDDVIDVPAKVQPNNIYINGNTVTKTWVAETGDAVGKSEYYTEAWLPSDTEKQNVITSSNKLVVSQDDTSPPLTSAYHAGGAYQSTTSVALNCNDFTGSGCGKTYYTVDGSEPTVNSAVYASAFDISSATTLKFFSVDALGNTEVVKTEKYVIVPEQDSPIGHWKFDEESGDTALDSVGKNNGVITGATRVEGKMGGALSFDADGDRVVLGNDPSLKVFPQENWSFAAWINPNGTGDPWQTIFNGIWHKPWLAYMPFGNEENGINPNSITFGFFGNFNNNPRFLWRIASVANSITPDQWNHVGITSDGKNYKLFINGKLAGSVPYDAVSDVDHPHFRTHGGYIIGNIIEFDAPQSSFSGRIDDVRIYNKALSESEINALIEPGSDITPPEVIAFNVEPKEIDTSESDQEITASITVTDDISGACFNPENQSCPEGPIQVQIQESGGNNAVSMYEFTRISGDILNGVYTGKVKVFKGSPAGIWKATLKLTDKAGNRVDIDTADLESRFGAGAATVVNGIAPINFVQVSSPNGGEFYKIGQTQRISWSAAGVAKVRIYIYDDRINGSGSANYLTSNNDPVLAANGFFDWKIEAADIPSPLNDSDAYHYKIRLEGLDNNGNMLAEDASDNYFAVVSEFTFHQADVNHDNAVNIKDIQSVIREIVGTNKICMIPADFNCQIDVNKDGIVNIKDIQTVIRAIVGRL